MCSSSRILRSAAACALLAAIACGGEQRTELRASAATIQPAFGYALCTTHVVVHGSMPVKPEVSLSGSDSTVEASYRAWIGETELLEVRWVDAETLEATVPQLAPGAWPLTIQSPFGDRSVIQNAFQVLPGSCSQGASLAITATAEPATVQPGGTVTVTATVTNGGNSTATGVSTAVVPPAGFQLSAAPSADQDVTAGRSAAFTWTYQAVEGASRGTFAVTAAGIDASNGQTVSASPFTTSAVVVQYPVGGAVSGLEGKNLTLRLNGANDLVVTPPATPGAPVTFSFATPLASGSQFAVTIAGQPSQPTQTCTVSGATGTVGTGPVTSVVVNCGVNTFTVGGNVAGLAGSGLVLHEATSNQNVSVTSAGSFAFATPIPSGRGYSVTVAAQPTNPAQTCAVTNGSGTVGSTDVTSVGVTCTTSTFSVGGTVSGLAGSGLVLRLNGVTNLPVTSSGPFSFPGVPSGTQYVVVVQAQPSNPTQTCTVQNGVGTVAGANVTSVAVTCTTTAFAISGTVSGLAGTGLVLRNGTSTVSVPIGAQSFTLPAVPSGTSYNVVVQTQPTNPTQVCTVSNGSGTVGGAPVTNVAVSCGTADFTVGGTVSGLAGTGLVLLLNGQTELPVGQNGAFTFPAVASGTSYAVTVRTQPTGPTQTCSVANGTGTVGGANVTNVTVTCTTATFSVGGSVSGLLGRNLKLQLTYGTGSTSNATPQADGPFTFPASVPSGAAYSVAVSSQPRSPAQICTVQNGTGTVGAANVTSVSVTCSGASFLLTTSVVGNGAVLCNGTACAPDYPAGTIVALTADPTSTGLLIGWLVDGVVDPACATTGPCPVTMTADHSVTATFSGP